MAQRLSAVTETTVVTSVKLQPKTKQMIMERVTEHAKLAATVKELKGTKKAPGRMKRIEKEVEELFRKDKQAGALADGVELGGFKLKVVAGSTSKFDKLGFMKKHNLSQADFDEFTSQVPNASYLKITAPGEKDDE